MNILPSTGAFIGRVNGRDHRLFLSVFDRIPADSYEFMMYDSFYGREEQVLSDFLASGLSFPVFHVEKRVGELIGEGEGDCEESYRRFRKNCEAAVRLGAEKLVLHLWNGLPSDHAFDRHLTAYATFAEIATAHGLLLTVENVVCACGDPMTHFEELLALYPNASFTFDTKMAAFHRQEYALLTPGADSLWPHVKHIHFNDYNGIPGDFSRLAVLHLGEGNIDLARIARGILLAGYQGTITLECSCMRPDGSLTPDKMTASLALAHRLFDKTDKE
jgi:sugar phosphate isomerase/epimerase